MICGTLLHSSTLYRIKGHCLLLEPFIFGLAVTNKKIIIFAKMRKEFGKWLMDIAKYITTAVILTSIFGDVDEKWIIYTGGSLTVILTLMTGLWLVKEKKGETK